MSHLDDRRYLREEQYRDDRNLAARIALHARYSTNPRGLLPWLFERVARVGDDVALLDVGCGNAQLWVRNQDEIPDGWRLLLGDLSEGMLARAREGLAARALYAALDAQALPFDADAFDVVVANFMIYHVPDRTRAIGEFRRVLRPGGTLFAATNGAAHMRELAEFTTTIDPENFLAAPSTAFGLENGAAQLEAHFDRVELERYEDGLVVTEVEPLLAYLRSMRIAPESRSRIDTLAPLLEARLARDGAIRITKDSGLFVAT